MLLVYNTLTRIWLQSFALDSSAALEEEEEKEEE